MKPTPRRVVAALLAAAAVLLLPTAAHADPPQRLAAQVTDAAGVLGDRAAVDTALADLRADTGIQLFVVLVDSFDGVPAQDWTDETARLSDLGDRDALLAVATGDRAYAYSFPPDSRLTDAEIAEVAEKKIEPGLARGDWSGAVVAGAQGYADATGSGSGLMLALVVIAVVIVAALAWVLLRRRRSRPATPAPSPGPSLTDLADQANALLIELDDDLRAAERELDLAAAQYGPAATATFRAALDSSRQDVAEAFRLRMTLEETPPPSDPARHETLTRIIELCRAADTRLDAESESFDELRDLEGRAAEAADELDRRRTEVESKVPAAEATAQELAATYSGGTVTAITTNAEQARVRLTFAGAALDRARAALADGPGGRTEASTRTDGTHPTSEDESARPPASFEAREGAAREDGDAQTTPRGGRGDAAPGGGQGDAAPGGGRADAALAVRAAEQAIDQAEQMLQAIDRAATDLPAARAAADALLAEVNVETAAGRAALTGGSPAPAGLAAAVAGGEQALAEVGAALAGPRPDPVAAVDRLQAADAALDTALAEARDQAERAARARSLLAQALPVARAEVAAVNDFIATRRGVIGSAARTSLSEAQRHLALAEGLAVADPNAALAEAEQARRLAGSAGQAARSDVQGWDGGGYGGGGFGGGGFDAGSFAGAVLGGMLAGGGRSHGGAYGGRSGGWSGGGFGGSGARGRRTGGSGGSGGRRSGGGRF